MIQALLSMIPTMNQDTINANRNRIQNMGKKDINDAGMFKNSAKKEEKSEHDALLDKLKEQILASSNKNISMM